MDINYTQDRPFKNMLLNETIALEYDLKMQRYAHKYAARTGKKFKTKKIDGILYVKRVK